MKKKSNLTDPITDFLQFFIHYNELNGIFTHTLAFYEKQIDSIINAKIVLDKIQNKEVYSLELKKKFQDRINSANAEVDDNYFSIKSSQLVLIYSRFESAISELIFNYFMEKPFSELPSLENIKLDTLKLLTMTKRDQKLFLAENYMQQKTLGVKYGFNRFENLLEPLFGKSKVENELKEKIYFYAQLRNLLIHRNGVIDKQFKYLIKNTKQSIGKKIKIDESMLNTCMSSIIEYSSELLDRIRKNA